MGLRPVCFGSNNDFNEHQPFRLPAFTTRLCFLNAQLTTLYSRNEEHMTASNQSAPAPKDGFSARVERLLPELAIASVVMIWSLTGVVIKDTYDYVQPLALTVTRFALILLIAVVALGVYRRRTGASLGVARKDLPRLILSGLTGYTIYQFCYVLGLDRSTAFAAAVLGSMTPVYTIVLLALMGGTDAALWLDRHADFVLRRTCLCRRERRDRGRIALGNAAAGGCAAELRNLLDHQPPVDQDVPDSRVHGLHIAVRLDSNLHRRGAAMDDQDWSALPTRTWFVILYLAIFPVYLAYQFWNYGIKHLGVATVSTYSLLIPVFGGIFAVLLLDESFTALMVVGGVIVLAGLGVMRLARR